MKITVNGNNRDCNNHMTVADLLQLHELTHNQVAVEINEVLVPRKSFSSHEIQDGDVIEIVSFVGGG